jgi:hypothetical protein
MWNTLAAACGGVPVHGNDLSPIVNRDVLQSCLHKPAYEWPAAEKTFAAQMSNPRLRIETWVPVAIALLAV